MGTKTNTTLDSAADAAQLAASKKPNGIAPIPVAPASDKSKRSAKAEAGKATAGSDVDPGPDRGFTQDDIALRAYFIAERRRAQGLAGDQHQDWLEAEREIIAETQTTAPSKTRKTRR